MKQFWTIFKFELKNYFKNKVFIGVTIFLVAVIALATFIPNIISSISEEEVDIPKEDLPIMLVKSEDEGISDFVNACFTETFSTYNVVMTSKTADEIKEDILAENAECAFIVKNATSYEYLVNNFSMYDSNAEIAEETLLSVYQLNALKDKGIENNDAIAILSAQIDGTTTTLGKNQMANFFYTYIMVFALYMVILLYGQMVASSVATEKSSKAMEVLITSAKPTNMMFGKVLSSCVAGFTQLLVVFGSAILFYNINKKGLGNPIIASIFNMPLSLFIFMLVFFILGFLIYAFLFGAVGSTATKLEDINTSVMPITFLFVIGFIIVITAMSSGSVDGPLVTACSYIPFTSPMAMFTRIAMSTVAWYEIAISIAILVLSVIGIGFLSAKIYRIGVLMYGNKPKIKDLILMALKKD